MNDTRRPGGDQPDPLPVEPGAPCPHASGDRAAGRNLEGPAFVLLSALALALAAPAPASGQEADPADVATQDAIIEALYDVISGPAGEARDWDRFRSLFIPEGARLIPTGVDPRGNAGHTVPTCGRNVSSTPRKSPRMGRQMVRPGRELDPALPRRRALVDRHGHVGLGAPGEPDSQRAAGRLSARGWDGSGERPRPRPSDPGDRLGSFRVVEPARAGRLRPRGLAPGKAPRPHTLVSPTDPWRTTA